MKETSAENLRTALILLTGEGDCTPTIQAIERVGGQIRDAYLPHAVIALVPLSRVHELVGRSGIASVDTDAIPDARLDQLTVAARSAAAVWNEYRRAEREAPDPSRPLRWDAPGHLPPDPPEHIRELWRQREREMQAGGPTDSDSSQDR